MSFEYLCLDHGTTEDHGSLTIQLKGRYYEMTTLISQMREILMGCIQIMSKDLLRTVYIMISCSYVYCSSTTYVQL